MQVLVYFQSDKKGTVKEMVLTNPCPMITGSNPIDPEALDTIKVLKPIKEGTVIFTLEQE